MLPRVAVKRDTATDLAQRYGVSRSYIVQARHLQKTNPKLFREVQEGLLSLSTAVGRTRTAGQPLTGLGVYFIGPGPDQGPTKIGRTENLYGRLDSLQIGHWARLTVLLWIPTEDPAGVEGELHQMFDKKLVSGEWYDLTTTEIDAVSRDYPCEVIHSTSLKGIC